MNKRYSKIILAALIASILFSSCASIFTKSTYPVSINTTPADATVTITDKKGNEVFVGQTPTVVKLKSSAGFFSKAEYQIKLSLNGYEEKVMTITSSIEGWYFANILLGGDHRNAHCRSSYGSNVVIRYRKYKYDIKT